MSTLKSYQPLDPLYIQQSHFEVIGRLNRAVSNTSGIERIWREYSGAGIAVGVWDDGVQKTHWDLAKNYNESLQVSVLGTLNDGQPSDTSTGHGTAVAGLIGASQNDRGGVGVAFGSQLTGVTVFGGLDDINAAPARYARSLEALGRFDITNHSYGASPSYQVGFALNKFETASQDGRDGLGTINVKSAGNLNIDAAGEPLSASRFTITVAAVGTSGGLQTTDYSSYGSHLLISAPEGAITTDLLRSQGYNGLLAGDYTNIFGGSSAAAAIVSGTVGLMLEANPQLGWRDVYDILSLSAMGADSVYTGTQANENFAWKWNGAKNWNGGGLHFSEDYGFGVVNVFNAVRMAQAWTLMHRDAKTSANEVEITTGDVSINQAILDRTTSTYNFDVKDNIQVEHVSLMLSLTQATLDELRVTLTSPSGTTLTMYDGTGGEGESPPKLEYTFGLTGFRGELTQGRWALKIQDTTAAINGTLARINFSAFGSEVSKDHVYHFTDEVLSTLALSGQAGRATLVDRDGGEDWVNAAAMYKNLVIDLKAGASSYIDGQKFLHINPQSVIENAIAGDGDDQLFGNSENNLFYGGRGDDVIIGGGGVDTAGYMGISTRYSVALTPQEVWVTDRYAYGEGVDTLQEISVLSFNDRSTDLRDYIGATQIASDALTFLAKMYIAYFNRAPDSAGLFYWGTRMNDGMSLENIAESFFVQPETVAQYQNTTNNSDFVKVVYNNVLGRDPESLGLNYWVSQLENGGVSKPTFMLAVIYGAQATTGSPQDALYLVNKTKIGSYYSITYGMNDIPSAREVMGLFDGSVASIRSAKNAIDEVFEVAQLPDSGQLLLSLRGVIDDPFAGFV